MREVPECLNRRYKAVDNLIQQLSWSVRNSGSNSPDHCSCNESADPGIKLMCDFWNILKENPDCDLKAQVKQCMGLTTPSSNTVYPQELTCYNIADNDQSKWKECASKIKSFCCHKLSKSASSKADSSHCKSASSKADSSHCKSVNGTCKVDSSHRKPPESPSPKTPQSVECCVDHPLNKALCSVNEAATFETQCNNKINDLIITQLKLVQQIEILEMREKEGIKLLKKADSMWSCMEDSYKKRLRESTDRQNVLLKQIREIEASSLKFRKNRKDLENKIGNMKKSTQRIDEQIVQKKTDIKFLNIEIADIKKRIVTTKADVNTAKKNMETKKRNSEVKISNWNGEMCSLMKALEKENKNKMNKEQSGNTFVKEGRQELQNICRILLRKRLENEDRRAEKAALLEEIDLLNVTMNQCKNRCKVKQDTLDEDIMKLDQQIATYKIKCIQCNKCTDSHDITRFCLDCPRCSEERDCIYEDGFCIQDSTNTCVCMEVKEKFLDNVFDNMYTVLERHSKNAQGKQVAETIMSGLKHSRNGKLNSETKKLLQDFILSTLRKNLNLTIIGGAVKTRCELEPQTYEQLMLCLKKVTPEQVGKVEKATEKKDPCKHWRGRVSECHCPSGPKDCACSSKAPELPEEKEPKDEGKQPKDAGKQPKDAAKRGDVFKCTSKGESVACGSECGMFDALMKVGADMSKWKPDPCSGPACSFKNVRAVQCMLGPEVLIMAPKKMKQIASPRPLLPICANHDFENMINTSCSKFCCTDIIGPKDSFPRERIIEEVMGRYIEVSPIQKVKSGKSGTSGKRSPFRRSFESNDFSSANNIRHFDDGCKSPTSNIKTVEKSCDVKNTINNKLVKKYNDRLAADNYNKLEPKTSKINLLVDISETIVLKDTAEIEKLRKEHVYRDVTHGRVVMISSDPELDINNKTNKMSFIVILDSKFYAPNKKISASSSSFTSCYSDFGSSIFGDDDDDGSSVGYLIRNVDICNVAEDLIKEVIVSESKTNNYLAPDIEWMTIPSFISKLNRRSKNSFSNLSNDEVEIRNTTLEAKMSSNKEKNNNSIIKKFLNDTVREKVKESLIKSLNTFHNHGSQYTYNEITKLFDTANMLSESKEELSSSSLSGSPIKTESQVMMNQACDSFRRMNLFDPSMKYVQKFDKITVNKSVNWYEGVQGIGTSASMTSTSTTFTSTSS